MVNTRLPNRLIKKIKIREIIIEEKKYYDVVGFGGITLDYLCYVDHLARNDKVSFIKEVNYSVGGCVPTALTTIQRLGDTTTFISRIGNDWMGNRILEKLKKEGLGCEEVKYDKKITSSFSFVQIEKNTGERAISYYPGASEAIIFDSKSRDLIDSSKALIIDGLITNEDIKAAEYANKVGKPVLLDANIIFKNTNKLLPYIDYLVSSENFLYEYSNSQDIKSSLKKIKKDFNTEVLITTLGRKGSVVLLNNEIVYIEAFNVDAIDTTGAGDVYHGGFLFGILKGWDIKDIMIFSSAVAALKCTSYGGWKGIPDMGSVICFLEKRKIDIKKFI